MALITVKEAMLKRRCDRCTNEIVQGKGLPPNWVSITSHILTSQGTMPSAMIDLCPRCIKEGAGGYILDVSFKAFVEMKANA